MSILLVQKADAWMRSARVQLQRLNITHYINDVRVCLITCLRRFDSRTTLDSDTVVLISYRSLNAGQRRVLLFYPSKYLDGQVFL